MIDKKIVFYYFRRIPETGKNIPGILKFALEEENFSVYAVLNWRAN
jgi:hypothetical protein